MNTSQSNLEVPKVDLGFTLIKKLHNERILQVFRKASTSYFALIKRTFNALRDPDLAIVQNINKNNLTLKDLRQAKKFVKPMLLNKIFKKMQKIQKTKNLMNKEALWKWITKAHGSSIKIKTMANLFLSLDFANLSLKNCFGIWKKKGFIAFSSQNNSFCPFVKPLIGLFLMNNDEVVEIVTQKTHRVKKLSKRIMRRTVKRIEKIIDPIITKTAYKADIRPLVVLEWLSFSLNKDLKDYFKSPSNLNPKLKNSSNLEIMTKPVIVILNEYENNVIEEENWHTRKKSAKFIRRPKQIKVVEQNLKDKSVENEWDQAFYYQLEYKPVINLVEYKKSPLPMYETCYSCKSLVKPITMIQHEFDETETETSFSQRKSSKILRKPLKKSQKQESKPIDIKNYEVKEVFSYEIEYKPIISIQSSLSQSKSLINPIFSLKPKDLQTTLSIFEVLPKFKPLVLLKSYDCIYDFEESIENKQVIVDELDRIEENVEKTEIKLSLYMKPLIILESCTGKPGKFLQIENFCQTIEKTLKTIEKNEEIPEKNKKITVFTIVTKPNTVLLSFSTLKNTKTLTSNQVSSTGFQKLQKFSVLTKPLIPLHQNEPKTQNLLKTKLKTEPNLSKIENYQLYSIVHKIIVHSFTINSSTKPIQKATDEGRQKPAIEKKKKNALRSGKPAQKTLKKEYFVFEKPVVEILNIKTPENEFDGVFVNDLDVLLPEKSKFYEFGLETKTISMCETLKKPVVIRYFTEKILVKPILFESFNKSNSFKTENSLMSLVPKRNIQKVEVFVKTLLLKYKTRPVFIDSNQQVPYFIKTQPNSQVKTLKLEKAKMVISPLTIFKENHAFFLTAFTKPCISLEELKAFDEDPNKNNEKQSFLSAFNEIGIEYKLQTFPLYLFENTTVIFTNHHQAMAKPITGLAEIKNKTDKERKQILNDYKEIIIHKAIQKPIFDLMTLDFDLSEKSLSCYYSMTLMKKIQVHPLFVFKPKTMKKVEKSESIESNVVIIAQNRVAVPLLALNKKTFTTLPQVSENIEVKPERKIEKIENSQFSLFTKPITGLLVHNTELSFTVDISAVFKDQSRDSTQNHEEKNTINHYYAASKPIAGPLELSLFKAKTMKKSIKQDKKVALRSGKSSISSNKTTIVIAALRKPLLNIQLQEKTQSLYSIPEKVFIMTPIQKISISPLYEVEYEYETYESYHESIINTNIINDSMIFVPIHKVSIVPQILTKELSLPASIQKNKEIIKSFIVEVPAKRVIVSSLALNQEIAQSKLSLQRNNIYSKSLNVKACQYLLFNKPISGLFIVKNEIPFIVKQQRKILIEEFEEKSHQRRTDEVNKETKLNHYYLVSKPIVGFLETALLETTQKIKKSIKSESLNKTLFQTAKKVSLFVPITKIQVYPLFEYKTETNIQIFESKTVTPLIKVQIVPQILIENLKEPSKEIDENSGIQSSYVLTPHKKVAIALFSLYDKKYFSRFSQESENIEIIPQISLDLNTFSQSIENTDKTTFFYSLFTKPITGLSVICNDISFNVSSSHDLKEKVAFSSIMYEEKDIQTNENFNEKIKENKLNQYFYLSKPIVGLLKLAWLDTKKIKKMIKPETHSLRSGKPRKASQITTIVYSAFKKPLQSIQPYYKTESLSIIPQEVFVMTPIRKISVSPLFELEYEYETYETYHKSTSVMNTNIIKQDAILVPVNKIQILPQFLFGKLNIQASLTTLNKTILFPDKRVKTSLQTLSQRQKALSLTQNSEKIQILPSNSSIDKLPESLQVKVSQLLQFTKPISGLFVVEREALLNVSICPVILDETDQFEDRQFLSHKQNHYLYISKPIIGLQEITNKPTKKLMIPNKNKKLRSGKPEIKSKTIEVIKAQTKPVLDIRCITKALFDGQTGQLVKIPSEIKNLDKFTEQTQIMMFTPMKKLQVCPIFEYDSYVESFYETISKTVVIRENVQSISFFDTDSQIIESDSVYPLIKVQILPQIIFEKSDLAESLKTKEKIESTIVLVPERKPSMSLISLNNKAKSLNLTDFSENLQIIPVKKTVTFALKKPLLNIEHQKTTQSLSIISQKVTVLTLATKISVSPITEYEYEYETYETYHESVSILNITERVTTLNNSIINSYNYLVKPIVGLLNVLPTPTKTMKNIKTQKKQVLRSAKPDTKPKEKISTFEAFSKPLFGLLQQNMKDYNSSLLEHKNSENLSVQVDENLEMFAAGSEDHLQTFAERKSDNLDPVDFGDLLEPLELEIFQPIKNSVLEEIYNHSEYAKPVTGLLSIKSGALVTVKQYLSSNKPVSGLFFVYGDLKAKKIQYSLVTKPVTGLFVVNKESSATQSQYSLFIKPATGLFAINKDSSKSVKQYSSYTKPVIALFAINNYSQKDKTQYSLYAKPIAGLHAIYKDSSKTIQQYSLFTKPVTCLFAINKNSSKTIQQYSSYPKPALCLLVINKNISEKIERYSGYAKPITGLFVNNKILLESKQEYYSDNKPVVALSVVTKELLKSKHQYSAFIKPVVGLSAVNKDLLESKNQYSLYSKPVVILSAINKDLLQSKEQFLLQSKPVVGLSALNKDLLESKHSYSSCSKPVTGLFAINKDFLESKHQYTLYIKPVVGLSAINKAFLEGQHQYSSYIKPVVGLYAVNKDLLETKNQYSSYSKPAVGLFAINKDLIKTKQQYSSFTKPIIGLSGIFKGLLETKQQYTSFIKPVVGMSKIAKVLLESKQQYSPYVKPAVGLSVITRKLVKSKQEYYLDKKPVLGLSVITRDLLKAKQQFSLHKKPVVGLFSLNKDLLETKQQFSSFNKPVLGLSIIAEDLLETKQQFSSYFKPVIGLSVITKDLIKSKQLFSLYKKPVVGLSATYKNSLERKHEYCSFIKPVLGLSSINKYSLKSKQLLSSFTKPVIGLFAMNKYALETKQQYSLFIKPITGLIIINRNLSTTIDQFTSNAKPITGLFLINKNLSKDNIQYSLISRPITGLCVINKDFSETIQQYSVNIKPVVGLSLANKTLSETLHQYSAIIKPVVGLSLAYKTLSETVQHYSVHTKPIVGISLAYKNLSETVQQYSVNTKPIVGLSLAYKTLSETVQHYSVHTKPIVGIALAYKILSEHIQHYSVNTKPIVGIALAYKIFSENVQQYSTNTKPIVGIALANKALSETVQQYSVMIKPIVGLSLANKNLSETIQHYLVMIKPVVGLSFAYKNLSENILHYTGYAKPVTGLIGITKSKSETVEHHSAYAKPITLLYSIINTKSKIIQQYSGYNKPVVLLSVINQNLSETIQQYSLSVKPVLSLFVINKKLLKTKTQYSLYFKPVSGLFVINKKLLKTKNQYALDSKPVSGLLLINKEQSESKNQYALYSKPVAGLFVINKELLKTKSQYSIHSKPVLGLFETNKENLETKYEYSLISKPVAGLFAINKEFQEIKNHYTLFSKPVPGLFIINNELSKIRKQYSLFIKPVSGLTVINKEKLETKNQYKLDSKPVVGLSVCNKKSSENIQQYSGFSKPVAGLFIINKELLQTKTRYSLFTKPVEGLLVLKQKTFQSQYSLCTKQVSGLFVIHKELLETKSQYSLFTKPVAGLLVVDTKTFQSQYSLCSKPVAGLLVVYQKILQSQYSLFTKPVSGLSVVNQKISQSQYSLCTKPVAGLLVVNQKTSQSHYSLFTKPVSGVFVIHKELLETKSQYSLCNKPVSGLLVVNQKTSQIQYSLYTKPVAGLISIHKEVLQAKVQFSLYSKPVAGLSVINKELSQTIEQYSSFKKPNAGLLILDKNLSGPVYKSSSIKQYSSKTRPAAGLLTITSKESKNSVIDTSINHYLAYNKPVTGLLSINTNKSKTILTNLTIQQYSSYSKPVTLLLLMKKNELNNDPETITEQNTLNVYSLKLAPIVGLLNIEQIKTVTSMKKSKKTDLRSARKNPKEEKIQSFKANSENYALTPVYKLQIVPLILTKQRKTPSKQEYFFIGSENSEILSVVSDENLEILSATDEHSKTSPVNTSAYLEPITFEDILEPVSLFIALEKNESVTKPLIEKIYNYSEYSKPVTGLLTIPNLFEKKTTENQKLLSYSMKTSEIIPESFESHSLTPVHKLQIVPIIIKKPSKILPLLETYSAFENSEILSVKSDENLQIYSPGTDDNLLMRSVDSNDYLEPFDFDDILHPISKIPEVDEQLTDMKKSIKGEIQKKKVINLRSSNIKTTNSFSNTLIINIPKDELSLVSNSLFIKPLLGIQILNTEDLSQMKSLNPKNKPKPQQRSMKPPSELDEEGPLSSALVKKPVSSKTTEIYSFSIKKHYQILPAYLSQNKVIKYQRYETRLVYRPKISPFFMENKVLNDLKIITFAPVSKVEMLPVSVHKDSYSVEPTKKIPFSTSNLYTSIYFYQKKPLCMLESLVKPEFLNDFNPFSLETEENMLDLCSLPLVKPIVSPLFLGVLSILSNHEESEVKSSHDSNDLSNPFNVSNSSDIFIGQYDPFVINFDIEFHNDPFDNIFYALMKPITSPLYIFDKNEGSYEPEDEFDIKDFNQEIQVSLSFQNEKINLVNSENSSQKFEKSSLINSQNISYQTYHSVKKPLIPLSLYKQTHNKTQESVFDSENRDVYPNTQAKKEIIEKVFSCEIQFKPLERLEYIGYNPYPSKQPEKTNEVFISEIVSIKTTFNELYLQDHYKPASKQLTCIETLNSNYSKTLKEKFSVYHEVKKPLIGLLTNKIIHKESYLESSVEGLAKPLTSVHTIKKQSSTTSKKNSTNEKVFTITAIFKPILGLMSENSDDSDVQSSIQPSKIVYSVFSEFTISSKSGNPAIESENLDTSKKENLSISSTQRTNTYFYLSKPILGLLNITGVPKKTTAMRKPKPKKNQMLRSSKDKSNKEKPLAYTTSSFIKPLTFLLCLDSPSSEHIKTESINNTNALSKPFIQLETIHKTLPIENLPATKPNILNITSASAFTKPRIVIEELKGLNQIYTQSIKESSITERDDSFNISKEIENMSNFNENLLEKIKNELTQSTERQRVESLMLNNESSPLIQPVSHTNSFILTLKPLSVIQTLIKPTASSGIMKKPGKKLRSAKTPKIEAKKDLNTTEQFSLQINPVIAIEILKKNSESFYEEKSSNTIKQGLTIIKEKNLSIQKRINKDDTSDQKKILNIPALVQYFVNNKACVPPAFIKNDSGVHIRNKPNTQLEKLNEELSEKEEEKLESFPIIDYDVLSNKILNNCQEKVFCYEVGYKLVMNPQQIKPAQTQKIPFVSSFIVSNKPILHPQEILSEGLKVTESIKDNFNIQVSKIAISDLLKPLLFPSVITKAGKSKKSYKIKTQFKFLPLEIIEDNTSDDDAFYNKKSTVFYSEAKQKPLVSLYELKSIDKSVCVDSIETYEIQHKFVSSPLDLSKDKVFSVEVYDIRKSKPLSCLFVMNSESNKVNAYTAATKVSVVPLVLYLKSKKEISNYRIYTKQTMLPLELIKKELKTEKSEVFISSFKPLSMIFQLHSTKQIKSAFIQYKPLTFLTELKSNPKPTNYEINYKPIVSTYELFPTTKSIQHSIQYKTLTNLLEIKPTKANSVYSLWTKPISILLGINSVNKIENYEVQYKPVSIPARLYPEYVKNSFTIQCKPITTLVELSSVKVFTYNKQNKPIANILELYRLSEIHNFSIKTKPIIVTAELIPKAITILHKIAYKPTVSLLAVCPTVSSELKASFKPLSVLSHVYSKQVIKTYAINSKPLVPVAEIYPQSVKYSYEIKYKPIIPAFETYSRSKGLTYAIHHKPLSNLFFIHSSTASYSIICEYKPISVLSEINKAQYTQTYAYFIHQKPISLPSELVPEATTQVLSIHHKPLISALKLSSKKVFIHSLQHKAITNLSQLNQVQRKTDYFIQSKPLTAPGILNQSFVISKESQTKPVVSLLQINSPKVRNYLIEKNKPLVGLAEIKAIKNMCEYHVQFKPIITAASLYPNAKINVQKIAAKQVVMPLAIHSKVADVFIEAKYKPVTILFKVSSIKTLDFYSIELKPITASAELNQQVLPLSYNADQKPVLNIQELFETKTTSVTSHHAERLKPLTIISIVNAIKNIKEYSIHHKPLVNSLALSPDSINSVFHVQFKPLSNILELNSTPKTYNYCIVYKPIINVTSLYPKPETLFYQIKLKPTITPLKIHSAVLKSCIEAKHKPITILIDLHSIKNINSYSIAHKPLSIPAEIYPNAIIHSSFVQHKPLVPSLELRSTNTVIYEYKHKPITNLLEIHSIISICSFNIQTKPVLTSFKLIPRSEASSFVLSHKPIVSPSLLNSVSIYSYKIHQKPVIFTQELNPVTKITSYQLFSLAKIPPAELKTPNIKTFVFGIANKPILCSFEINPIQSIYSFSLETKANCHPLELHQTILPSTFIVNYKPVLNIQDLVEIKRIPSVTSYFYIEKSKPITILSIVNAIKKTKEYGIQHKPLVNSIALEPKPINSVYKLQYKAISNLLELNTSERTFNYTLQFKPITTAASLYPTAELYFYQAKLKPILTPFVIHSSTRNYYIEAKYKPISGLFEHRSIQKIDSYSAQYKPITVPAELYPRSKVYSLALACKPLTLLFEVFSLNQMNFYTIAHKPLAITAELYPNPEVYSLRIESKPVTLPADLISIQNINSYSIAHKPITIPTELYAKSQVYSYQIEYKPITLVLDISSIQSINSLCIAYKPISIPAVVHPKTKVYLYQIECKPLIFPVDLKSIQKIYSVSIAYKPITIPAELHSRSEIYSLAISHKPLTIICDVTSIQKINSFNIQCKPITITAELNNSEIYSYAINSKPTTILLELYSIQTIKSYRIQSMPIVTPAELYPKSDTFTYAIEQKPVICSLGLNSSQIFTKALQYKALTNLLEIRSIIRIRSFSIQTKPIQTPFELNQKTKSFSYNLQYKPIVSSSLLNSVSIYSYKIHQKPVIFTQELNPVTKITSYQLFSLAKIPPAELKSPNIKTSVFSIVNKPILCSFEINPTQSIYSFSLEAKTSCHPLELHQTIVPLSFIIDQKPVLYIQELFKNKTTVFSHEIQQKPLQTLTVLTEMNKKTIVHQIKSKPLCWLQQTFETQSFFFKISRKSLTNISELHQFQVSTHKILTKFIIPAKFLESDKPQPKAIQKNKKTALRSARPPKAQKTIETYSVLTKPTIQYLFSSYSDISKDHLRLLSHILKRRVRDYVSVWKLHTFRPKKYKIQKFKPIVDILHIYSENSEKNDLNNEYSEEFYDAIQNSEDIIQETDMQESFEIVLNSPLELFVYKSLLKPISGLLLLNASKQKLPIKESLQNLSHIFKQKVSKFLYLWNKRTTKPSNRFKLLHKPTVAIEFYSFIENKQFSPLIKNNRKTTVLYPSPFSVSYEPISKNPRKAVSLSSEEAFNKQKQTNLSIVPKATKLEKKKGSKLRSANKLKDSKTLISYSVLHKPVVQLFYSSYSDISKHHLRLLIHIMKRRIRDFVSVWKLQAFKPTTYKIQNFKPSTQILYIFEKGYEETFEQYEEIYESTYKINKYIRRSEIIESFDKPLMSNVSKEISVYNSLSKPIFGLLTLKSYIQKLPIKESLRNLSHIIKLKLSKVLSI